MEFEMETTWKNILEAELKKTYFVKLNQTVSEAYLNQTVFPAPEQIFNAFTLCPFEQVKVVILGQDPYHGAGQAHGLSFSVPAGIKIPPSLRNIYKEIQSDTGTAFSESGNLERWATQGVLLLNATLTVEQSQPGSHQGLGWETFTDAVIKTISDQKEYVVFLLWGKYAQAKQSLIDEAKHLVLQAPHPSPFSAHSGFFGCKHFSKANAYLMEHGRGEIVW